jgi:predicted nucleotidyltransferase
MNEMINTSPLKLEPFTYVKDSSDFIYYIKGSLTNEGIDGYSAVCVYYPDELGDRSQLHSGTRYSKFASQGLQYERSSVMEHMPKSAAEYVLNHGRTGDIFNQQFLFLPAGDIIETYSPESSLQAFLNGSEGLNSMAVDATRAAAEAFASFSIPLGALGLYGSLQCGVSKNAQSDPIKDVDMLVRGVDYYDNVHALALALPAPESELPLTVSSDTRRSLAVKRRREIAQFGIPDTDGIHCDVRLLRKLDDPNSYLETTSKDTFPITIEAAAVTDARQSLSLPFAYQIIAKKNKQQMWVVGNHYRLLGVAAVGDNIEVQGIQIAYDTILVSHPTNDWVQLRV